MIVNYMLGFICLLRTFGSKYIAMKLLKFSGTHPSLCFNSHLYMSTRKTIALTIQTFVDKSDVSAF